MGRVLALDYGIKRTGVAVSDILKITANGLDTLETPHLLDFLKKYISTEEVDALVLGKASHLNGTETDSTPLIEAFSKTLEKEFPKIPVHFIDERFTSKMAQAAILQSGVGKMRRRDKGLVDKVSAVLILQSYLLTIS